MMRSFDLAPQQTAEQARDQIREQAQQIREQAQQIRQQALEQAQAAREARQGGSANGQMIIHVPPIPPLPQIPTTGYPEGFGRHGPTESIPEAAIIITLAFFAMIVLCVIGWPIARAFGRRIDRKSERVAGVPDDVTDRLARIEQQVEAIAIEIERVSEGQRFSTKLLTEMREIPLLQSAPAAERVPIDRR